MLSFWLFTKSTKCASKSSVLRGAGPISAFSTVPQKYNLQAALRGVWLAHAPQLPSVNLTKYEPYRRLFQEASDRVTAVEARVTKLPFVQLRALIEVDEGFPEIDKLDVEVLKDFKYLDFEPKTLVDLMLLGVALRELSGSIFIDLVNEAKALDRSELPVLFAVDQYNEDSKIHAKQIAVPHALNFHDGIRKRGGMALARRNFSTGPGTGENECFFATKNQPACVDRETQCLMNLRRDKLPGGCVPGRAEDFDALVVLRDVLLEVRTLHARMSESDSVVAELVTERDQARADARRYERLVLLGDLNAWLRDTVVVKSFSDGAVGGKLQKVDEEAKIPLQKYLPWAGPFCDKGPGAVPATIRAKVTSNFKVLQGHIQMTWNFDLVGVFQNNTERNGTMHIAPPPASFKQATDLQTLQYLDGFLNKYHAMDLSDVLIEKKDRADVQAKIAALIMYYNTLAVEYDIPLYAVQSPKPARRQQKQHSSKKRDEKVDSGSK